MNDLGKLKSFIESARYEENHCLQPNESLGNIPFITISRQSGAGGHTLAEMLLTVMKEESDAELFSGWHICDQEICRAVVEESRLSVSLASLMARESRSDLEDMACELILGDSPQSRVMHEMFRIIQQLARRGKVIILGRGGVSLTRDYPAGVHIRIVASLHSRIEHMARYFKINETEAKKRILDQDKARQRLIKTYFYKNIDDPLLYDAIWNTDRASFEEIARSVIALIKQRSRHCGFLGQETVRKSHWDLQLES